MSLENRRGSQDADPITFVTNDFASRNGGGSKDLLLGVPVDPRSNQVHRHSVQFLDDLRLIARMSDFVNKPEPAIVISVSYASAEQPGMNRAILAYARCERILFIALEEKTAFFVDDQEYEPMSIGDISGIPLRGTRLSSRFRLSRGSGIYVVMGQPVAYSFGKGRAPQGTNASGFKTMNGLVELSSEDRGTVTVNRRVKGKHLPVIACPDCRRPLEIRKKPSESVPGLPENSSVLVTVVCDEREARSAIVTGNSQSSEYTRKIVLVTNDALLSPDLCEVWTEHDSVFLLYKHKQRRGLTDYHVPSGYVSPLLFPKAMNPPLKESAYTIIQAVACAKVLGETVITLIDPDGKLSVNLRPSTQMHEQMMDELRDWNHPCHKGRKSAISFIKEWVQNYTPS